MPDSKKRKKTRRAYRTFRAKQKITHCKECGKKLSTELHHNLCNQCHRAKKLQEKTIKNIFLSANSEGDSG